MCISIHVSSQWLPWCDFDIVRGVCLSQDLPGGGWTSANSKVLSHEITGVIKPSLSPALFSTSSLSMWLSPCVSLSFTSSLSVPFSSTPSFPIHHTPCSFLLDAPLKPVSPSPHPHPLASIGHKERIQHLFFWVLLKLQMCQLACSRAVPKPLGFSDLSRKCNICRCVNACDVYGEGETEEEWNKGKAKGKKKNKR